MSDTQDKVIRRKRFVRAPDRVADLRISDRAHRIVAFVARFRFVDFEQIARYDGGSSQKVSRICRALFDAGYLDRPTNQVTNFWTQSYKPLVYALGDQGAELLAQSMGISRKKLDWQLKNERAGNQFIDHAVETTEHMLSFLISARERQHTLVDHRDLLTSFPFETRRAKNPFAINVKLDGEEQRLVPDRLFSMVHEPSQTRFNYALETDRGTMPNERLTFGTATSFVRKLPLYLCAHLDGQFKKVWGFDKLRVLTIVPNERRLANIVAALARFDQGTTNDAIAATQRRSLGKVPPGLFLFTTPDRLAAASPLDEVWTNRKGERVDLGIHSR